MGINNFQILFHIKNAFFLNFSMVVGIHSIIIELNCEIKFNNSFKPLHKIFVAIP